MLRWGVVLVVAVAVAAACRGGGDEVVTLDSVAGATRSAETARLRLEISYAGGDEPAGVSEGVVDFESGDEEVRHAPLGPGAGDDDAFLVRFVGEEFFVRSRTGPGDGALWVRFPLSAAERAEAPGFDPVSFADALADASGELTESGTGEVNGDPTTVYRLELPSGSDVLPVLVVPADATVDATLEVDAQGRVRRLLIEPHHPGPADDGGSNPQLPVPERSELLLWDYGVDVQVDAPPQDATVGFDTPGAVSVFDVVDDWPRGEVTAQAAG